MQVIGYAASMVNCTRHGAPHAGCPLGARLRRHLRRLRSFKIADVRHNVDALFGAEAATSTHGKALACCIREALDTSRHTGKN
jgi:tRNA A37 threonylcarbamoyladenosine dehydratase